MTRTYLAMMLAALSVCAYAQSRVTYSGLGSYTCSDSGAKCASVDQQTHQNNVASLNQYRYESDRAQDQIEQRRQEEEMRRRDKYRQ